MSTYKLFRRPMQMRLFALPSCYCLTCNVIFMILGGYIPKQGIAHASAWSERDPIGFQWTFSHNWCTRTGGIDRYFSHAVREAWPRSPQTSKITPANINAAAYPILLQKTLKANWPTRFGIRSQDCRTNPTCPRHDEMLQADKAGSLVQSLQLARPVLAAKANQVYCSGG